MEYSLAFPRIMPSGCLKSLLSDQVTTSKTGQLPVVLRLTFGLRHVVLVLKPSLGLDVRKHPVVRQDSHTFWAKEARKSGPNFQVVSESGLPTA